jgi:hypothetical protein
LVRSQRPDHPAHDETQVDQGDYRTQNERAADSAAPTLPEFFLFIHAP